MPDSSEHNDYGERGRRVMPASLRIGAASIVVGMLGIAWNLLSIGFVARSYQLQRELAQDRAAAREAMRAELEGRGSTGVIFAPAPPPSAGLLIGVGLCVALFIVCTMLAIVLTMAGVMLVRGSPQGWPLHRLYVPAKIPPAMLAGVAWWWMLRVQDPRGATQLNDVLWAITVVLLGCAYPALLWATGREPHVVAEHSPAQDANE